MSPEVKIPALQQCGVLLIQTRLLRLWFSLPGTAMHRAGEAGRFSFGDFPFIDWGDVGQ